MASRLFLKTPHLVVPEKNSRALLGRLSLYFQAAAKQRAKTHQRNRKYKPAFTVTSISIISSGWRGITPRLKFSPSTVEKRTNIPNPIESRYVRTMKKLIAKTMMRRNPRSGSSRLELIIDAV
jgi:hypothetical protein